MGRLTWRDARVAVFFLERRFQQFLSKLKTRRSHWPRGLRLRSAAAQLLGLRVRIPSWARMSVCCVLSGGGCDEPIPRPGKSYRVCVHVCVCV